MGLKYNNDKPNPKAITRIIEKMLFKGDKSDTGKVNSNSCFKHRSTIETIRNRL
jgi:hypothetical protein